MRLTSVSMAGMLGVLEWSPFPVSITVHSGEIVAASCDEFVDDGYGLAMRVGELHWRAVEPHTHVLSHGGKSHVRASRTAQ